MKSTIKSYTFWTLDDEGCWMRIADGLDTHQAVEMAEVATSPWQITDQTGINKLAEG